MCTINSIYKH